MGSFKRKTYGPVKPVKKAKIPPPAKPSSVILHGIFRQVANCSSNQHIDLLAKALYWWQDTVKYIKYKRPTLEEKIDKSRQLLTAYDWQKKGQHAPTNAEKERCFVAALESFRKFGEPIVVVNPIALSMKAYHERNKKIEVVVKKIAPRFDGFLTTLMAAFNSCPFTLQVVPKIENVDKFLPLHRKFDHALGKMLYSRELAVKLMKESRTKGLLAVAVEEARYISRAMAYVGVDQGAFIVDKDKQLSAYMQLMADFVIFASVHPDAPKRLVKSKTSAATGKKAKVARVGARKSKGVMSQLLDEMEAEAITKAVK